MTQMGLTFEVMPSGVNEHWAAEASPADLAQALALQKGQDIAARTEGPCLVVSADTVVYQEQILGKPANPEEAVQMLKALQGRRHQVFTGVALVDLDRAYQQSAVEETWVDMAPLTPAQIAAYAASGEPMDKAGAYGIQGLAALFVKAIHGCYFNVMGLPIHRLGQMLWAYHRTVSAGYQRAGDWQ
jgi:septum formation protein